MADVWALPPVAKRARYAAPKEAPKARARTAPRETHYDGSMALAQSAHFRALAYAGGFPYARLRMQYALAVPRGALTNVMRDAQPADDGSGCVRWPNVETRVRIGRGDRVTVRQLVYDLFHANAVRDECEGVAVMRDVHVKRPRMTASNRGTLVQLCSGEYGICLNPEHMSYVPPTVSRRRRAQLSKMAFYAHGPRPRPPGGADRDAGDVDDRRPFWHRYRRAATNLRAQRAIDVDDAGDAVLVVEELLVPVVASEAELVRERELSQDDRPQLPPDCVYTDTLWSAARRARELKHKCALLAQCTTAVTSFADPRFIVSTRRADGAFHSESESDAETSGVPIPDEYHRYEQRPEWL